MPFHAGFVPGTKAFHSGLSHVVHVRNKIDVYQFVISSVLTNCLARNRVEAIGAGHMHEHVSIQLLGMQKCRFWPLKTILLV